MGFRAIYQVLMAEIVKSNFRRKGLMAYWLHGKSTNKDQAKTGRDFHTHLFWRTAVLAVSDGIGRRGLFVTFHVGNLASWRHSYAIRRGEVSSGCSPFLV